MDASITEKICSKCGEVKSVSDFHQHNRDGYRSWCKECEKANNYRKKNPEGAKKSDAKYRDSHRVEIREYVSNYGKNHREIRKFHWTLSAARRRGGDGTFSMSQWALVCEHYGNKCLRCGSADFEMDHIFPVSLGGPNTINNVQPLCGSCNKKKGTKTIDYRPDSGAFSMIISA